MTLRMAMSLYYMAESNKLSHLSQTATSTNISYISCNVSRWTCFMFEIQYMSVWRTLRSLSIDCSSFETSFETCKILLKSNFFSTFFLKVLVGLNLLWQRPMVKLKLLVLLSCEVTSFTKGKVQQNKSET